jgi:hypothetical protein
MNLKWLKNNIRKPYTFDVGRLHYTIFFNGEHFNGGYTHNCYCEGKLINLSYDDFILLDAIDIYKDIMDRDAKRGYVSIFAPIGKTGNELIPWTNVHKIDVKYREKMLVTQHLNDFELKRVKSYIDRRNETYPWIVEN